MQTSALTRWMAGLILLTASAVFPVSSRADLSGDLRRFWEQSGGGVNVTGPSAYNGQRAGFVTLGSVQVRTPVRNSALANIQLPSVRAGCGGIDIFGGSFSFISREELIHLMEAIMQNAAGFAFELALESMSPAVQETVAKLRDLIQQVNSMNINSCEAGQALAASLWPRMDGASQHICATIGSYQGMFADRIASRHGCNSGGQQNATLRNASEELRAQVPIDVNYAWEAIKQNAFLISDRSVAEFFMTLTGTVITTAPSNDSQGPNHRPIAPRAGDSDLINVLIEGGTARIQRCNDTARCLNPSLQNVTIPISASLLSRATNTIRSIQDAIRTPGAQLSNEAVALLGMTNVPVLDILITGMSYQHVFVEGEINAMAEVVAVDLAMIYIDQALGEMAASAGRVQTFGEITFQFQEQIRQTQEAFGTRRQLAAERYSQAMRTLERLTIARTELAAYASSRFAAMVTGD